MSDIEYFRKKIMEIMKVPKSFLNDSSLPIIDMPEILPGSINEFNEAFNEFNTKVKEISNQVFYDIMINGEAYYSIDKNANITRLTREEFDELNLTNNRENG